MKKVIFLSFVVLVLGCNPSLARQSVFNSLDNSVSLECLRLKQNGQIGNECYEVTLHLGEDKYLAVQSVSAPKSLDYEDSDPFLDVETSQMSIPKMNVGLDVYSVSLAYDTEHNRLSINSLTLLHTENSGTESTGTCNFEGQSSWFTATLTGAGYGVCFAYDKGVDVNSASQACASFGGIWNVNTTCPGSYLNACLKTDAITNISFTEYTYDKGAIEFYNASVVALKQSGGDPSILPTPTELLSEACINDNGIPF